MRYEGFKKLGIATSYPEKNNEIEVVVVLSDNQNRAQFSWGGGSRPLGSSLIEIPPNLIEPIRKLFAEALERDPKNYKGVLELCNFLGKIGEEAIKHFDEKPWVKNFYKEFL